VGLARSDDRTAVLSESGTDSVPTDDDQPTQSGAAVLLLLLAGAVQQSKMKGKR
jgi:hypothetical protein